MSTSITRAYNRTRFSQVCLCGVPKRKGFPFCLACVTQLGQIRKGLRADSIGERHEAFLEACKYLGLDAQEAVETHPVYLTEDQLDGLFLGATIEGKRVAIAALIDWSRIDRPRQMPYPTNHFNEVVRDVEAAQEARCEELSY